MINLNLFKIESISTDKVAILCNEDGKIFEYEDGILYDTDDNLKRTTSYRMSKVNLTINKYESN